MEGSIQNQNKHGIADYRHIAERAGVQRKARREWRDDGIVNKECWR